MASRKRVPTRFSRPGAALTAGVLIALAAGCGEDTNNDTLTKAQVIERASAVCRSAEKRVASLPELATEHPFAKGTTRAEHRQARRFLAGYADLLDSTRTDLGKLAAPDQDRELLEGYIAEVGQAVAKLRQASRADAGRVESEAQAGFALFDRASRKTAAYGFPKGVCGSGAS